LEIKFIDKFVLLEWAQRCCTGLYSY